MGTKAVLLALEKRLPEEPLGAQMKICQWVGESAKGKKSREHAWLMLVRMMTQGPESLRLAATYGLEYLDSSALAGWLQRTGHRDEVPYIAALQARISELHPPQHKETQ